MYLNIFDEQFNRLSVLPNYTEVEITRNYYSHSSMIIYIDATKKISNFLLIKKKIGLLRNQQI